MKRTLLFSLLLTLLASGFAVSSVSAETNIQVSNNGDNAHSNIHVENNTGENTNCVNGKCTTSGGSGNASTHACINDKCYDSSNGNLDASSDDGNDQVHIRNNNSSTPTTSSSPSVTFTENISASVSPTLIPVNKKMDEAKKNLDVEKQQVKKELAQNESIIQKVVDSMKSFFASLHFFSK